MTEGAGLYYTSSKHPPTVTDCLFGVLVIFLINECCNKIITIGYNAYSPSQVRDEPRLNLVYKSAHMERTLTQEVKTTVVTPEISHNAHQQ